MDKLIEQVKKEHKSKEKELESRIKEFNSLKTASEERLFQELVFVILSSQTSAKKAWKAAEKLGSSEILLKGSEKDIEKVLNVFEVQQEKRKSKYIITNRKQLSQPTLTDPDKKIKIRNKIYPENLDKSRRWFAENIKGLSWKGSSHFLRNIGYGNDFAIISNHIIHVLHKHGLRKTTEPPKNYEEYIEDEKILQELAAKSNIDIKKLDLILWSLRTGEIFK